MQVFSVPKSIKQNSNFTFCSGCDHGVAIKLVAQIIDELKNHDYYNNIKDYVEAMTIRNLFRYTLQQKYQKDKKLANKFIDDTFNFLNKEFPNWRKNRIWKKRNILKRTIEQNKLLTKLYIRI